MFEGAALFCTSGVPTGTIFANDVSSTSHVGVPLLNQSSSLAATGVSSATSVAKPALGQKHTFAAPPARVSLTHVGTPAVSSLPPVLQAANWEKFGAVADNFTFTNDGSGNLVITASGTVANSGIALKTSYRPAMLNGRVTATMKFTPWAAGIDQIRCGIGFRIQAGPDCQFAALGRTTAGQYQTRHRDLDNGVPDTIAVGVNLGTANGDNVFWDMDTTFNGRDIDTLMNRAAQSPIASSALAERDLGAGQIGVFLGNMVAGMVCTISAFDWE